MVVGDTTGLELPNAWRTTKPQDSSFDISRDQLNLTANRTLYITGDVNWQQNRLINMLAIRWGADDTPVAGNTEILAGNDGTSGGAILANFQTGASFTVLENAQPIAAFLNGLHFFANKGTDGPLVNLGGTDPVILNSSLGSFAFVSDIDSGSPTVYYSQEAKAVNVTGGSETVNIEWTGLTNGSPSTFMTYKGASPELDILATLNLTTNFLQQSQIATPANPPPGDIKVYAKADSGFAKLFYLQSDGTEVGPLGSGGSGEANTGANVGTGQGNVFRDKTGVTLNFKTLLQGSNITITDNADDITIAATGTGNVLQAVPLITSPDGSVGELRMTNDGALEIIPSQASSAPANVTSFLDLELLATNPATQRGRIWRKEIDANNEGLFAFLRKGATTVEVQIA